MNRTRGFGSIAELLSLLIGMLWVLLPIVWLVLQSLTLGGFIVELSPTILTSLTSENYVSLYLESPLLHYLANSLLTNVSSATIVLILGSMAGYAFSRYRTRAFENAKFWYLSTQFIPPICVVIPVFIMMVALNLINTYEGLIWVYTAANMPFGVWMSAGFFESVPEDIEEAFVVDGCTQIRAFFEILPLVKGGLAATFLFTFLLGWNEFLFALILTRYETMTLPVGLSQFVTVAGLKWGQMAGMGVLMLIPIVLLTAVLQKHLVRGLTMGAVKG
jgi:ABC-type glycerol-3-phosphate transport system permease component